MSQHEHVTHAVNLLELAQEVAAATVAISDALPQAIIAERMLRVLLKLSVVEKEVVLCHNLHRVVAAPHFPLYRTST